MNRGRMLEGFAVGFLVGVPTGLLLLPTLVLLLHLILAFIG